MNAAAHAAPLRNPTSYGYRRSQSYTFRGDRLRADRQRCELTQLGLARRIGVARSLITQLELGACEPSLKVLAALCLELGTSSDWLLNIEFEDDQE